MEEAIGEVTDDAFEGTTNNNNSNNEKEAKEFLHVAPPTRILKRLVLGICWLGCGIRKDLRRHLPWYLDDWREGFHFRVLGSIFYTFFTSIAPAITFGIYIQDATDNEMGVVEVLFSTALCGTFCACFFGQPLVIVGVTGPVSVLYAALYDIASSTGVDFLSFTFWTGVWAFLMHVLLAVTNTCYLIKYITRFSCEVFALLIGDYYSLLVNNKNVERICLYTLLLLKLSSTLPRPLRIL